MATLADPQTPAAPVKPTLDTLSPSQIEAIRRIPAHDAGQKPTPMADWLGAGHQEDAARLDLPSRTLRSRAALDLPRPAGAADALRAAARAEGDIVAFNGYGPALIVARGKDGRSAPSTMPAAQGVEAGRALRGAQGGALHLALPQLLVPTVSTAACWRRRGRRCSPTSTSRNTSSASCRRANMPGMIWGVLDPEVTPDWSAMEPEGAGGFARTTCATSVPPARTSTATSASRSRRTGSWCSNPSWRATT
ncbi:hypothetical protein AB5I41_08795 [Sphingomonas sp. MMS24-JH45]